MNKSLSPSEANTILSEFAADLHSPAAEKILIGTILLEAPRILDDLLSYHPGNKLWSFNASMCFVEEYRGILRTILKLWNSQPRRPVTVETVSQEMGRTDAALYELAAAGTSYVDRHEEFYAEIFNLYLRRLAVALGSKIQRTAAVSDPAQVQDAVLSLATTYANASAGDMDDSATIGDAMGEAHDQVIEVLERGDHMIGLPTGFADIDDALGGMPPGELIVVVADTSAGKTQFGLQMIEYIAAKGESTVVFSMEMNKSVLALRMAAKEAGLDILRLRRAQLTSQEWVAYDIARKKVEKLPIFVDDTPSLSPRSWASRMYQVYAGKVKIALIDYLQLFVEDVEGYNQYNSVTRAMTMLHSVARMLNIPLVVLSNTSRSLASSAEKRPTIHSGLGSGAIERYADDVWGLFRNNVYAPEATSTRYRGEFLLLKFRNGPITPENMMVPLGFYNGQWMDIGDLRQKVTGVDEKGYFTEPISL